jgi:hypothetical protein
MYIHIGYGGDNSTITIINHEEKNVVACMSYGFTLKQLESCICEIITKYIPNTVIDIERNGPGCSLIAKLFNTKLKNNIHYETKEKELNINPLKLFKKTIKIYGADNSVKTCMVLIEVLGKLNNKGEEHGKQ